MNSLINTMASCRHRSVLPVAEDSYRNAEAQHKGTTAQVKPAEK